MSYWDFEKSLTAMYVMNAEPSPPSPQAELEMWHGFDETLPLPEELKEAASMYFELKAYRYLDLAVVSAGEAYKVVNEAEMAPLRLKLKTPGSLAVIPVVSALRSFYAEGERGLATGLALAGLLAGRLATKTWRIALNHRLGLPRTLVAPVYVWRT
ncbi:MAG: hypothetical protein QW518_03320 [Thermofilaceae archaeon]